MQCLSGSLESRPVVLFLKCVTGVASGEFTQTIFFDNMCANMMVIYIFC